MNDLQALAQYHFESSAPAHTDAYLTPVILRCCRELNLKRVLDVGCGNGALCAALAQDGVEPVGCDPSIEGIALARHAHPELRFDRVSVYDDADTLKTERFDAVISTEVIEHLFQPRMLPRFASQALPAGGYLILSTPYHGYLKNLALSLAGKWDFHFSPLWDGGHIKFWSRSTLTQLLEDEGFHVTRFVGAGRLPYLWKSMVIIARKRG